MMWWDAVLEVIGVLAVMGFASYGLVLLDEKQAREGWRWPRWKRTVVAIFILTVVIAAWVLGLVWGTRP